MGSGCFRISIISSAAWIAACVPTWSVLEVALERALTDRAWALVGLREALELVRGRPFDVPAGYEWAYEELHVAHAERVVTEAAHRLATVALEAGEWQLALWATTRGLVARAGERVVVSGSDARLSCRR